MATPQDLLNANANLATLDAVVTSTAETVPDRLGQNKLTLSAISTLGREAILAVGWNPVGNFTTGCTLQNPNDTVTDGTKTWRWDGVLPKVIAAGSTATPTGNGAFKQVSDEALRAEISEVPSIKQLRRISGITQPVRSFVADSGFGGGQFIYYPAMSETLHTGGTVIAAAAVDAWDGTQEGLPTLLNYTGTGNGCYVRVNYEQITAEMFGAIGNNSTDNRVVFAAIMNNIDNAVLKCPKDYFISGIARINIPSNLIIDMCGTGSFRRNGLVNAANFYDYSMFHFENVSNSGIINGSFIGINSNIANSNNTTGVSVSVGEGCEKLIFDNLFFDEGWTGLLIGTNLSADNFSKKIKVTNIRSQNIEQTVVASAVKNILIENVEVSSTNSTITQRGVFLQNVQDAVVDGIITNDVAATSVYVKAYAGIFPAANITIWSVTSANSTALTNVAVAIHTTNSADANAGDVTKHVTIGSISTDLSGAALQIIAEKDDQLQNIIVGSINGTVRDSVIDIRLNGKRINGVVIDDILANASAAEYGIIVDGGGSAFSRRVESNIVINSYRYTDKGDATQDVVLIGVDGVTIGAVDCVAEDLNSSLPASYLPPTIRTTNTINCNIGCSDTRDIVSVGDHLLKVNGELFGSASTIYVDADADEETTANDQNNGKEGNPLKTITAAFKLIPNVCNSNITLNVAAGTYSENPVLQNKTFNEVFTANFNGASVGYLSLYNVSGRPTQCNLNGLQCSSNSVANLRVSSCTGLTIDDFDLNGSGSIAGIDAKSSTITVSNTDFGTGFAVALAADYGGTVVSVNNTGNGTSSGLRARFGSVIAKSGTQPTGTSANESVSSGGEIR